MWPYIIGEPTESGEVDMKMEEKEEEEGTSILNNLIIVSGRVTIETVSYVIVSHRAPFKQWEVTLTIEIEVVRYS